MQRRGGAVARREGGRPRLERLGNRQLELPLQSLRVDSCAQEATSDRLSYSLSTESTAPPSTDTATKGSGAVVAARGAQE